MLGYKRHVRIYSTVIFQNKADLLPKTRRTHLPLIQQLLLIKLLKPNQLQILLVSETIY